jgi:hypothetical protein
MALHRLLETSPLGPEEIKRMTDAYEEALRLLRLSDRSDRLTELVAIQIVAITHTGERDPSIIASRAMKLAGIHPAASQCLISYSILRTVSRAAQVSPKPKRVLHTTPKSFSVPERRASFLWCLRL